MKSGKVRELLLAMVRHKDSSAILIRLAYILGNLTTNWEEVRLQLCKTKGKQSSFQILIDLAIYYFDKEENPSKTGQVSSNKYEDFTKGNLEDALTKVVKLLANLSTEEGTAISEFSTEGNQSKLKEFLSKMLRAVDTRTVEQNEEFILNAISCTTNILYYDTATSPLLDTELRSQVFRSCAKFLLATQNEEIQIETVRVLSNLSRHS